MQERTDEYRVIDLNTYPRRAHFDYFRTMAYPYVGVTVETDVTDLHALCKRNRLSFYLLFMHAAALAADSVPELRQRIRDGGIIEYKQCATSHTESVGDGTYCYCTLRHHLPLEAYLREAEEARSACRERKILEEDADADRLYFISTLPWLSYTQLIQPTAGGDESNPRITWGKFAPDQSGRLMMPVSILCHHALVDGMHLAAFYRGLTEEMEKLCAEGNRLFPTETGS